MDIIRDIEISLGMKKFLKESDNEYRSRLYYSTIGYWIQELVRITNGFYEEDIVDNVYLITNLKDKAIYLYRLLMIDNEWLQESEIFEFLKNLIDMKIDIFNLTKSKENKIYVEYAKIKFCDRIIGQEKNKTDKKLISMGYLGKFKTDDEVYIDIDAQIKENNRLLDSLLRSKLPKDWRCFSLDYDDLKLFIPNETGIFDKSWVDINLMNNSAGRYLGIDRNNNYYILDLNKDSIFLIDKYYTFENEIYRLMYHIYGLSCFEVNISISDKEGYYAIHIPNKLPNVESRVIKNIGWPSCNYNNYEHIVVSREAFDALGKLFHNLGLTFKIDN